LHVKILNKFGVKYLVTNPIERSIIEDYYKFSLPIADYLYKHYVAREIVRYALISISGIVYMSLFINPLVLLFLCSPASDQRILFYTIYNKKDAFGNVKKQMHKSMWIETLSCLRIIKTAAYTKIPRA
jgi:hypothetical protein